MGKFMRLHVMYLTKNNSFNSIEVNCNYRKDAIIAASKREDYQRLYRIIRLKDKPIKYNNYSGCIDDNLKRVKY